jgi:hypothetical protein
MSQSTRATVALNKVGVNFTLHSYDYDPDAERIGLQAVEAIGVEPRRVLKTLMAPGSDTTILTIFTSRYDSQGQLSGSGLAIIHSSLILLRSLTIARKLADEFLDLIRLCQNPVHTSRTSARTGLGVTEVKCLTVRPEPSRRAPIEFSHSLLWA